MAHTNEKIFTYDYVVIGGGTSGAVAAQRLAEGDTNSSVCLFEAGPSAYYSPMILMHSGIGSAAHQVEMGIGCKVDLQDELPHSPVEGEGVIAAFTLIFEPQARGTARLSSKDTTSKPIIDHAYLENGLGVAVFAEGCRIGHEVLMKGRGTKNIIVGPWPKAISHPMNLAG
ncbi:unnamed protein product [Rotaria sp. Silwood2]|nr:unnamed protein product [Rotaria sp. Silwood2]